MALFFCWLKGFVFVVVVNCFDTKHRMVNWFCLQTTQNSLNTYNFQPKLDTTQHDSDGEENEKRNENKVRQISGRNLCSNWIMREKEVDHKISTHLSKFYDENINESERERKWEKYQFWFSL